MKKRKRKIRSCKKKSYHSPKEEAKQREREREERKRKQRNDIR